MSIQDPRARRWLLVMSVAFYFSVISSEHLDATTLYVRRKVRYRTVPRLKAAVSRPVRATNRSLVVKNNCVHDASEVRTIAIFISGRSPEGVTGEQWRGAVWTACQSWFGPAGCGVVVVADRQAAELVFNVAELNTNIMGETRIPSALFFPRVPCTGQKVRVFVNRRVRSLGHGDLLRTLKHEVGHAIGLPHDSRSVVGRRYADLTAHDRRMTERFRQHLNANWPS